MVSVSSLILLLTYLFFWNQGTHALAGVTIQSEDNYLIQRKCVQDALTWAVSDCGCENWYNECYCRSDMTSLVVSYLSVMIPKQCSSNKVDLSSGIEIYTSYCDEALHHNGVVTTTEDDQSATAQGLESKTSYGNKLEELRTRNYDSLSLRHGVLDFYSLLHDDQI